jgi:flavin reductase (DIM6/NTAB) family NADH-FMN oxidoreductase RutF
MTLDASRFRSTLGLFATGVAVIATEVGEQLHAMTANAVSSVSLDPMLVLFCPAKRARLSELLPQIESFSINFLRDEHQALSTYFAGGQRTGAVAPPFKFVAAGKTPRLEGALAALICTPHQTFEGGDHWIVTAHVTEIHQGIEPHRPLLFFKGQYRDMDRRHATRAPDLADNAEEAALMYYHL